jgi:hypothetical protein
LRGCVLYFKKKKEKEKKAKKKEKEKRKKTPYKRNFLFAQ